MNEETQQVVETKTKTTNKKKPGRQKFSLRLQNYQRDMTKLVKELSAAAKEPDVSDKKLQNLEIKYNNLIKMGEKISLELDKKNKN